MRNWLPLFFGLSLLLSCNSTPLKEYSDSDVEYISKTNTWIQKSDGSIIKESFVINDELFDGVTPHRREVIVDEDGHVITSSVYKGNVLLQKGDFTKAPHEVEITYTPAHPENDTGHTFYMQRLLKSDGETAFIKDESKTIIAEFIYDKQGNPIKRYDWENGKRVLQMIDKFPVENAIVGYSWLTSYRFRPDITFKIRNKTGYTVTESIKVYYKCIRGDEIVDSDSQYVTAYGGWDNNMIKTITIETRVNDIDRFTYPVPDDLGLRLIVTYEDGSVLYDGMIPCKIIN